LDQGSQEVEFLGDSQLNKEANRSRERREMIGAERGDQIEEAESRTEMGRILRGEIRAAGGDLGGGVENGERADGQRSGGLFGLSQVFESHVLFAFLFSFALQYLFFSG
jgi:hypothetical protein